MNLDKTKTVTFTVGDALNIETITKIKELANSKVVCLSVENGWQKTGVLITHKYFVNRDTTSLSYGQIIRELTKEEFNSFRCGFTIDGVISVAGIGETIYLNHKTGEEYRLPFGCEHEENNIFKENKIALWQNN